MCIVHSKRESNQIGRHSYNNVDPRPYIICSMIQQQLNNKPLSSPSLCDVILSKISDVTIGRVPSRRRQKSEQRMQFASTQHRQTGPDGRAKLFYAIFSTQRIYTRLCQGDVSTHKQSDERTRSVITSPYGNDSTNFRILLIHLPLMGTKSR